MSVLSKSDVFAASLLSWSWRARFPFWILKARPLPMETSGWLPLKPSKPVDPFFFSENSCFAWWFPTKKQAQKSEILWLFLGSRPMLSVPSSPIHALRERTSSAYSGMLLERACPAAQTTRVWNLKPYTFIQLISKCLYLYIFLLFFDLYNHVHWQRCFLKRSHLYFAIHHR